MPAEWDKTPAVSTYKAGTSEKDRPGGGAVAGIAIGLLMVVIALGLYIFNNKDGLVEDVKGFVAAAKKGKEVEVEVEVDGNSDEAAADDEDEEAPASPAKSVKSNASGADLEIEADGSILQEVMSEAGSPFKTPQKNKKGSGDGIDNEEDIEDIDVTDMPVSPSAEDSEII